MKSYGLFVYFVLAVLAIKSEARKIWLSPVSGFDRNNADTGYAGILNRPVTGLKVNGGCRYKVHLLNRGIWLPEVTGYSETDHDNGYAGTMNGDVIDGVAVSCGVEYAVHIQGGGWLPSVRRYDINDHDNGYAGILGKAIDAVMIRGRTYATSYNDNSSNSGNNYSNYSNTNKSSLLKKAEAAADYARDHNQTTVSGGWCLRAVDDALQYGGGLSYTRLSDAYLMHTTGLLTRLGFTELPGKPNPLKKGDICVTENNWKYESGHIQIYDGNNWYSDFRQYNEFVYYDYQPPNHYYRAL